jgi:tetratricopeptide (TPR) repeat protein/predicted Ser/Thr protein kinase
MASDEPVRACPDETALARFASGQLDAAERAALEAHVDSCDECRELISELARDSTLDGPSPGEYQEREADRTIGRYQIEDVLGIGGMGVVYVARDSELGRRVAVKLVRSSDDGSSAERHARLLREASTMAALASPYVVTVHDVGTHRGQVFIAMELVTGKTLRAWLDAKQRSWREILDMFLQAGRGLVAAHEAGIVHRDFKPDNVFVGEDGRVRVGDFGLAHAPMEMGPVRTDVLVGTLPYLAPELLAGAAGDARADQFAFGVALAEALAGKRPFTAIDRATLQAAHAKGPQLDGIARAHLRAILTRALAPRPADRFASMHELLAALEHDPTVRRRRLAIGGAVFAVGAIAASAVALNMRGTEGPSCADPRPLDGIWDPSTRAAWRAALERSTAPYARKIGADVEDGLDSYAQALHTGERSACEAVTRGAETHELSNARAACLARARSALGQLGKLLATADDAMIARAPLALAQLPALDECADAGGLLREDMLPRDPLSLGRVMTVRAEIDQGMILRYLGKHREALEVFDRALPRAAAAGHKPTYAAGLMHAAQATEHTKPPKEAEALHRSSLTVAQEGHADVTFAYAASSLALNLGRLQERFDEADTWLALATSTSARLGKPPKVEAFTHFAAAILANARRRFDEATREATYALEIAERANFDRARRAEMINTLGGIALSQGIFAEAGEHYARARGMIADVYGDTHPTAITIDGNLASVAFALGEFPRAVELRRSVLARRIAQLGPQAPKVGDDHIGLAFALDANSEGTAAIEEARAGAALLLAAKGANTAPGLRGQVNLAQILVANGAVDEAVALAKRTSEQLAALGPSGIEDRRAVLVVLANAAIRQGRTADAKPLLAEALSGDSASESRGVALRLQARLARTAGDNARAVELARRAQKIIATTAGPRAGELGMAFLEEGLAQVALREPEAAGKLTAAAQLLEGTRWKAGAAEATGALAALKR